MKIIPALPPNIDEIDRVFGVRKMLKTGPVWFAWGDRIYNPNRAEITQALMAHEREHAIQQKKERAALISLEHGVREWWEKYLADTEFRLAQEIPAHAAEYRWHLDYDRRGPPKGYPTRAAYHLTHIALRLASPLYGSLVPLSEAKRLISA